MRISAGIILIKGNQALMQLRDDKPGIALPGYWCIPGGEVKNGESIKRAAIREFYEETGYLAKNPTPATVEVYKIDGLEIKRHLFYEIYDGKQKVNCYEGQKMVFKSPNEFPKMKIYPGHVNFIKRILKLASKDSFK